MFNTYLSKFYHFVFLLLFVFSWMINSLFLLVIGIFSYVGILLLFRKSTSAYLEDIAFKKGVLFSPVNGRIVNITKNLELPDMEGKWSEVKVIINPWNETGIYLPTKVEIEDFSLTGRKPHLRYLPWSKKGKEENKEDEREKLSLTIKDEMENLIKMVFVRCYVGGRPEIFVMPGDRGKQQANIGHFPFGGTLFLYLPEKYEILIGELDQVVAGETLLAGLSSIDVESKTIGS